MKNYQSITITNEDDIVEETNGCPTVDDKTNIDDCHGNNPHPQDHLAPPFESNTSHRPSNIFVGTFNLIATIIGGAVLSLPIVFHKCGIAFTTCAMILSAYMTYMSLIMLCYCSRRCGGSSYGEVVRSAFGERMEEGVSWLLFVFLLFVITGYMVLIRDIWTPLLKEVFQLDYIREDWVLLGIVLALLPFLFQRSLHALRYNCYVGSASIFILCIALCRGGLERITSEPGESEVENVQNIHGNMNNKDNDIDNQFAIEFFKVPSSQDILFSFPIVTCAFLCHFNIIAIQNALSKPTRQRIENLTKYAIFACFILMYMFGLGGYLYAGSRTEGNILLNVPMARQPGEDTGEYYLFLLGRIGVGTTIMFAMPMMALPCREALLEVVDVWFHHSHHLPNESDNDNGSDGGDGEHASMASSEIREEATCWKILHRWNSTETVHDAAITTEDEITEILPEEIDNSSRDGGRISIDMGEYNNNTNNNVGSPLLFRRSRSASILIRHDPIQYDYVFRNTLIHYGSTMLITTACYCGAVAVSGVAVVWSFIGSSMAFFIAFILPCGCFIVIENAVPVEGGDCKVGWVKVAWVILVFSVVGAVVCTVHNTIGFGH